MLLANTAEWGGTEAVPPQTTLLGRLCSRWWGMAMLGAAVCTGAGILFALPVFGTDHWHEEIRIYLAQFWSWGLLTPAIVLLDRRLPYAGDALGKRLAAHILASLFFTEIYFY